MTDPVYHRTAKAALQTLDAKVVVLIVIGDDGLWYCGGVGCDDPSDAVARAAATQIMNTKEVRALEETMQL